MKRAFFTRRNMMMAASAVLLSGCSIIPKGGEAPTTGPTPEPGPSSLPQDGLHRVALLVPLSGQNGEVGQSIANATTMAILDTEASNLRITTYDTAQGPQAAARQALADGNKLILGPLLGSNVVSVRAEAAPAGVPIISFSNDTSVAGPGVFVMGHIPEQSIARSVEYARDNGADDFAILAPDGEYGDRAEAALRTALSAHGGNFVASERYSRTNTSVVSAGGRLRQRGGIDAVLIADGGTNSIRGGEAVKRDGLQILGTERWSGDRDVLRSTALRGALFSSVSDARYGGFVRSYEERFGGQPYRVATLGYDAVLLTLRAARDWDYGRPFPTNVLFQSGGFDGMDGPFRFQRNGVVERAMEVRRVTNGDVTIVSTAPKGF
ncbi:penicillin-binding protein activator [Qipengyuania sp. 1NDH17]|uniref:Penicillin-binding protein activator n=1 Tax=Qipengyuania polymorpha TaxID=2867234 RepID=A0ABS7IV68_9SPHN|nr:penicillin-binding protein activator [Qipengyuania polymorpha]MBX7457336.1 penicillin-binding protein activator [Qipengyuania polymorpha]